MELIDINAVQMVREIRDRLYLETKDLSTDELIEFYRERAAAVKRPAVKGLAFEERSLRSRSACPRERNLR